MFVKGGLYFFHKNPYNLNDQNKIYSQKMKYEGEIINFDVSFNI